MWLQRLVDATEARVAAETYALRPDHTLEPLGSFKAAIQRAYPALVAEIKPGRPTEQPRMVDPASVARDYAEGGACAISVLTDPDHFGGQLSNLAQARAGQLPLLMKDFLIDEGQLDAAAAWGASAVLVIARLHTEDYTEVPLPAMVQAAHDRGLEALVEVVSEEELEVALEAGADVLGVNTRDLDTLEVDEDRPGRLLGDRDLPVPSLHLSGIQTPRDVVQALQAGADGVLVGTSLMAARDRVAAVRALVELQREDVA